MTDRMINSFQLNRESLVKTILINTIIYYNNKNIKSSKIKEIYLLSNRMSQSLEYLTLVQFGYVFHLFNENY